MKKLVMAFCLICVPFFSAAQPQTLLVVGDSISAAYGIETDKGWVALLQEQATKQGFELMVVNSSISGDTTAGGLARLPKALSKHKPSWVMIALGANDGLRAQSLKAMRRNLTAMIKLVKAQGAIPILLGMRLPPNYGKKYTESFFNAYQKVAQKNDTLLLPFFIKGVGGRPELNQADGIHPNEKGQPIIKDNVWKIFKPLLEQ